MSRQRIKPMIRNRYNTLFFLILSTGMLFFGAKAYPVPWMLAEQTINDKCIMNFGDNHAPSCVQGVIYYPFEAVQLNEVLKRWVTKLKQDHLPTLFLLEWAQDGFVPAIYEGDTIPMLKRLSCQSGGNLEFKCADRRTTAIKSFGPEFWYPFTKEVSQRFEGKWRTFSLKEYKKTMIECYGPEALDKLEGVTASQFLMDIEASLKEIEMALTNIKDGKQQAILSQYHTKIRKSCIALECFFRNNLDRLDMPYYFAFVNSVFKNQNPTKLRNLYKDTMFKLTMNIADAGFFIDVVDAINNPRYARVVTYTGLIHMKELEKNLFDVYNVEPSWLGLHIPAEAQEFYHRVGTKGVTNELCNSTARAPELFMGNIAREDLCLKLNLGTRRSGWCCCTLL